MYASARFRKIDMYKWMLSGMSAVETQRQLAGNWREYEKREFRPVTVGFCYCHKCIGLGFTRKIRMMHEW